MILNSTFRNKTPYSKEFMELTLEWDEFHKIDLRRIRTGMSPLEFETIELIIGGETRSVVNITRGTNESLHELGWFQTIQDYFWNLNWNGVFTLDFTLKNEMSHQVFQNPLYGPPCLLLRHGMWHNPDGEGFVMNTSLMGSDIYVIKSGGFYYKKKNGANTFYHVPLGHLTPQGNWVDSQFEYLAREELDKLVNA